MAETFLSPVQVAIVATTDTIVYTVPPAKSFVGMLILCNFDPAVDLQYRVAVSVGGGAVVTKDYIAYDITLPATRTRTLKGIVAGPDDTITVRASTATLAVGVSGLERDSASGDVDYRVLGQNAPLATVLTDLYSPVSDYAVLGPLWVCNRSAADVTYRVMMSPAGVADDPSHRRVFDATVFANDAAVVQGSVGWEMLATDILRVYAATADLSFVLMGLGPVDVHFGSDVWVNAWWPPSYSQAAA